MSDRLQNRVALVTGAGQGIGEAIARRFVQEGAAVTGIDRNPETLQAVAADLPGFSPWTADLQDHAALEDCVQQTMAAQGRIDILVNCAGIQHTVGFLESDLDQWQETQRINLEAQYVLCKLVTPHMVQQQYGRIVNISSTQSLAAEPKVTAYAASKGGINAFTRSLAVELAEHNILVNAIAPGCIHTPLSVVNGVDETTTEEFQTWYVQRRKIPLARPGQPEEVAAAALFLASEECSYVTGHTLVIDGGLVITF